MTHGEPLATPATFEQMYKDKLELVNGGTVQLSAALRNEVAEENHHVGKAVEGYCSLLERGGKRTRGVLTVIGYEMYHGADQGTIRTAASVIEGMHAGLLVIDDVADAADLRRNGPTVHTYLKDYLQVQQAQGDTKKTGEDVAQVGALYAMHRAQTLLLTVPAPAENIVTAAHVLNDGMARTGMGQMLDILAAGCQDITINDIEAIATYKTAYYSYLLPLQVGSALAGAPREELEHYRDYSLYAGFAFQMQDDVMGIFSDETTIGKPNKSDISEGKKTLLVADALSNANAADYGTLRSALGDSELSDSHFERCKEIIKATGAYGRTVALAHQHAQKAVESLGTTPAHWPPEQLQFLRDMAWFGVKRRV